MVTHGWGGGTERHIAELAQALRNLANVVVLRVVGTAIEITVPEMPEVSVLRVENSEHLELINNLRFFDIDRVHIHHIGGQEEIVHSLITELSVPFDITIHDYYIICPQIHLHTPSIPRYCGEQGEEQCNRCIAEYNSFGAHDIREWRNSHAWFVDNAERVICPSVDVRDRIARYFPKANLIVAPHEVNLSETWVVNTHPISIGRRLRVGLIGHLIGHKGREIVEACLREAAQLQIEFMLIGSTQPPFPPDIGKFLSETGIYGSSELLRLLKNLNPHVIWFPQPVPETYSYTLSAAIDSGLPILATRIGALPERLAGRPLTWFEDDVAAPASKWLATFESIREQLARTPPSPQVGKRRRSEPYYPVPYLRFARPDSTPGVRRDHSAHVS
jgi:glycosyltransferase involved in cell wall biosynthesis